jgi:cell division protein FtsB
MRKIKYLIPLWVGMAIYTLFSILKGPISISAYNQLKIEHEKLKTNMTSLKLINKELEHTKNALLYDRDTIAVYARDLGYSTGRERFIRIVGFEGTKKQRTEPGELLKASKPTSISEEAIKICAFFIGLGTFLCVLIPDILQKKSERQRGMKSPGTYSQNREERPKAAAS